MKKVAMILAILLVVCIPLQAHATVRASQISPRLTFSGTTAKCAVTVYANTLSDHLEVTMWLMDGTTCVASWHGSGDGNYLYSDPVMTIHPYIGEFP